MVVGYFFLLSSSLSSSSSPSSVSRNPWIGFSWIYIQNSNQENSLWTLELSLNQNLNSRTYIYLYSNLFERIFALTFYYIYEILWLYRLQIHYVLYYVYILWDLIWIVLIRNSSLCQTNWIKWYKMGVISKICKWKIYFALFL